AGFAGRCIGGGGPVCTAEAGLALEKSRRMEKASNGTRFFMILSPACAGHDEAVADPERGTSRQLVASGQGAARRGAARTTSSFPEELVASYGPPTRRGR